VHRKPTPSGAFPEKLYFTDGEIDEICSAALDQSGLLPENPDAIRIERFVEKHFGCLVEYRDLGPSILGCAKFNGKGQVIEILVSSRLEDGNPVSVRRARTTFAHEAGHGLLHASLFIDQFQGNFNFKESVAPVPKAFMCRDSDIQNDSASRSGYDGKWWEFQANRAIGGLLLPKKLFRSALSSYLDGSPAAPILTARNRLAASRDLAELFDVNPIVVRIRLAEVFPEKDDKQLL
jgi:hypothetical protein